MKTIPSLPPPDTPWLLSKPVLDEAGFVGELHLLAPGATRGTDRPAPGDTLLFVVSGSVTAGIGRSNYILDAETTLRIPAGRDHELRNPTGTLAKVLVITLPPRAVHLPDEPTLLPG
ncbi:MAG TPA: cupin domain-containing protein [Rariglobus sp.]